MTNNFGELNRMVLVSVADDYEEMEMIVSEIAKWAGNTDGMPDRNQIEHALMTSILNKDVKAYEYCEKSCRFIPMPPDYQTFHALWFYITEQGKERLRRLEEESTKSDAPSCLALSGYLSRRGREPMAEEA